MEANQTSRSIGNRIDRRNLLKVGAGGLAALALLKTPGLNGPSKASAATAVTSGIAPGPLAWVWRFAEDGSPEAVRSLLAAHGVGILLKACDGVNWMAKYDKNSPMPISGPESLRAAAAFFEAGGVPFHAWNVVNGEDPLREAQLAAQVLDSGARTLTFDLEPAEGTNYWQTGAAEARILGAELRRLQPNAFISVAPDGRPWQLAKVPMAEFAAFCNDIAPQTYWRTFDSPANHRLLAHHGFPVGPEGVTPELIVDASLASLHFYGKPIRPVGQGAADRAGWDRFAAHAARLNMQNLSTWRVGTTVGEVWPVLGLTDAKHLLPPPPPPAPEPVPVAAAPVEEVMAQAPVEKPSTAAAKPTPAAETSFSRTTSSRSASPSTSKTTDWHDKLLETIKNSRPFGIGGAR